MMYVNYFTIYFTYYKVSKFTYYTLNYKLENSLFSN